MPVKQAARRGAHRAHGGPTVPILRMLTALIVVIGVAVLAYTLRH